MTSGAEAGGGTASLRLHALCLATLDPGRLADFWGGLLGWEPATDPDGVPALLPTDDTGFRLRFEPTDRPAVGRPSMHLHLTSGTPEHQQQTVARVLELGGRHLDVGQLPEEEHVVLADPEGNELCVIEPGNGFLADCGFLAELACDGSATTGRFWAAALGWPLVWDQDQETAIRSPHGGPIVAWGGPPLLPKAGPDRLHLDLAPPPGGDQQAEVARLLGLGATRLADADGGDRVVLADPDGHELCVLTPR